MKNKLFLLIVFISNLLLSQNPKNFISVDSDGKIHEVDPMNCTSTLVNSCSNIKAFSIALLNNEVYIIDGTNFPSTSNKLFKTGFNSSSNCVSLGSFQGTIINALTASPDGFIYAASDNKIERFDPNTNTFSIVGSLPTQWESSGDLIFHKGKLLMATKNNKLIEIDLTNLNNSKEIVSFPPGSQIFGLSTVNSSCGENNIFAINSTGFNTSLIPIDSNTNTAGTASCNLNFVVFDTASSAENGSTSLVTPTFATPAAICEGETLNALPIASIEGITGSWSPALDTTKTTEYTFSPSSGQCATTAKLTITVNPKTTPTFNAIAAICEGETLNALPIASIEGITGSWSPALDTTKTTEYTFSPSSGQCATTAKLTITVNPKTTPTFNAIAAICEGETLNALPIASIEGITGSWSPALDTTKTTEYTFSPSSGQCATTTNLKSIVHPLPQPNPLDGNICFDSVTNSNTSYTIFTDLDEVNHQFEWFKDSFKLSQNASSLIVNDSGTYTVIVKNSTTNCISKPKNVTVILINNSVTIDYTLTNAFEENQSIRITASGGSGNFRYQLDNGIPQSSPFFEKVKAGDHLITVIDNIGCSPSTLKVTLINYPHFFTPNGDGWNEYWNVIGLTDQPNSKIYLFDRYGKLLKEMSGQSLGWDGTFNGHPLPSSDYWFRVIYKEAGLDKEFRSHFSLKR